MTRPDLIALGVCALVVLTWPFNAWLANRRKKRWAEDLQADLNRFAKRHVARMEGLETGLRPQPKQSGEFDAPDR